MNRRRIGIVAGFLVALVLTAFAMLWLLRFHIADALVSRKLAAAGVPASYRLTRIGPLRERMEDVRIGDPAAPDLVARRIDVVIGYSLAGPTVRAVRADGVRLRARLDAKGFHLGALDRLLPASAGPSRLPDLGITLRDARLALATPNGTLTAAIDGEGDPQQRFRGTARLASPTLRLASCGLGDVAADLRIAADRGRPSATGGVRIATIGCPGLTMTRAGANVALSADPTFKQLALRAMVTGSAGGVARGVRFASVTGPIEASGTFGALAAKANIKVTALKAPAAVALVTRAGAALAGAPLIGPVAARAGDAVARLLGRADGSADLTATIHGRQVDVQLTQLSLLGRDGARVTATARGGMGWTAQGLRTDADIVTGGGALPAMTLQLRQTVPGAPLTGRVQVVRYAAGEAALAITPLTVAWNGRDARFATVLTIDGPIGDGFVRRLQIPVNGQANGAGAFAVGAGCNTIAFQQARISGFTLDAARLPVCGRPIATRAAGGSVRIDASADAIQLRGHSSAGAPVTIGAAGLHVTEHGFAGRHIAVVLGSPDRLTHLAIAALDGTLQDGRLAGTFVDAAGAIGSVPLDLSQAGGRWTFADGTLQLAGHLRVSDSVTPVRFNPLAADDARLRLKDGVITASATLVTPNMPTKVATVALAHDLALGVGHAVLAVPGLKFTPKGLQPDTLTPLTLGIIANVDGVLSGDGRIDWGQAGVTSSGTFGTDRLDLAAAFGPVAGIAGKIHFTDLLGFVSAPDQEATIAEVNPGVAVTNGVAHFQIAGPSRVRIADAYWPFAGGTLRLDPATLDFGADASRRLIFRVARMDAAAFIQQLDFPNIAATGTFDGLLPIVFDASGGRIEGGSIVARPGGGTLAYVGEISNAALGTMGKLAFDALKAIRYSALDIGLDGQLDGEMVSRVRFTGVREATPEQSLITRLIRNLPFRFNITIRAPFRGLVGAARAYIDPRSLLSQEGLISAPSPPVAPSAAIQPRASGGVR